MCLGFVLPDSVFDVAGDSDAERVGAAGHYVGVVVLGHWESEVRMRLRRGSRQTAGSFASLRTGCSPVPRDDKFVVGVERAQA